MTDRQDIEFQSDGDRIAAWFYPGGGEVEGDRGCVVMAHGFAGVREARLDAYAERFADAGLACLVFDYRHFGASGGEPRQLVDIKRQHADWRAAIAHARSLDGVDPGRIGLWGSSFSGGHVIALAAQDSRVAAVVSQGAFMDGLATLRAMGPVQALRFTVAGLRDLIRQLRDREPYTLPAVGPPGSLAVMNKPDNEPGYLAIAQEAPTWRNEAAARVLLRVGTYRPGLAAKRVRCPILFVVAEKDSIAPASAVHAAAARAPDARVVGFDVGHFDIYVGSTFERVVRAETEFLAERLGAARSRTALPAV